MPACIEAKKKLGGLLQVPPTFRNLYNLTSPLFLEQKSQDGRTIDQSYESIAAVHSESSTVGDRGESSFDAWGLKTKTIQSRRLGGAMHRSVSESEVVAAKNCKLPLVHLVGPWTPRRFPFGSGEHSIS